MNKYQGMLLLGALLFSRSPLAGLTAEVTVTATINATPCTVPEQDRNIHVGLGPTSVSYLESGGHSSVTHFQLHLHCDALGAKDAVRVTFIGPADKELPQLLAIDAGSTARGIALGIVDDTNTVSSVNKPGPQRPVVKGDNTLNFGAFVQGEPSAVEKKSIAAGEFSAVATTVFDYE